MFTALLEKIRQGNLSIEDIKAWIRSASLSYAELLQEEYSDWLKNPNIPELLSYTAVADFLRFEKDIHIEPETELGKYLVAIEGKIKEGLQLLEKAGNTANIIPIIEGLRNCSFGTSSTFEAAVSTLNRNPAIKELMPYYAGTKVQKSYQGKLFSIIKGINFAEEFRKKLSSAIEANNYLQQKDYLIEASGICMRAVELLWQVQQDLKIPSNKTERISNYVIKASLFLNAALVIYRRKLLNLSEEQYVERTQLPWESLDSTEQEIITKISQIEQKFLQIAKPGLSQALSEQLEIPSAQIAASWDDTVVVNKHILESSIRNYAAGEIANVNFEKEIFGPGYLTEEETEKVRIIYHTIADGIKALLTKVIEDCIRALDRPPCAHAFMCLGSLAREEATPYSDLELAILLTENTPPNRAYFYNLSVLITLKVQCLGETAIPKDVFKLGPLESFDEVVKPGLMLDLGGKTPIGRIDQGYSLIQTPEKMAEYVKNEAFRLGELLPIEVATFMHVYGDEELTEKYSRAVNKILDSYQMIGKENGHVSTRQHRAIKLLMNDARTFEPKLGSEDEEGKLFEVKKELYRLPSAVLDDLSLFYDIKAKDMWKRIDALQCCLRSVGVQLDIAILKRIASTVALLRLKTYEANNCQNEKISTCNLLNFSFEERIKQVFHVNDSKILFCIYFTLMPFYEFVVKYYLTNNFKISKDTIYLYNDSELHKGLIWKRLSRLNESENCFIKATLEEQDSFRKFKAFYYLGLTQQELEKNLIAKDSLQQALNIFEQEFGEVNKVLIYQNLAIINAEIGELDLAKEQVEKCILYWEQRETEFTHSYKNKIACIQNLANILYLLAMRVYDNKQALLCLALEKIATSLFVGLDAFDLVRSCLIKGTILKEMGKYQEAIAQLEIGLKIAQGSYCGQAGRLLITIQHNLAMAYLQLKDKKYTELSHAILMSCLEMSKHIGNDQLIIMILYDLGVTCFELKHYEDSLKYHLECLQNKHKLGRKFDLKLEKLWSDIWTEQQFAGFADTFQELFKVYYALYELSFAPDKMSAAKKWFSNFAFIKGILLEKHQDFQAAKELYLRNLRVNSDNKESLKESLVRLWQLTLKNIIKPQEVLLLANCSQYKSVYLECFGEVCWIEKLIAGSLWYFLQAYNLCLLKGDRTQEVMQKIQVIIDLLKKNGLDKNDVLLFFKIFLRKYPEIKEAGATEELLGGLLNAYENNNLEQMKIAQRAIDDAGEEVVDISSPQKSATEPPVQEMLQEARGISLINQISDDPELDAAIELSLQLSTQEAAQVNQVGQAEAIGHFGIRAASTASVQDLTSAQTDVPSNLATSEQSEFAEGKYMGKP